MSCLFELLQRQSSGLLRGGWLLLLLGMLGLPMVAWPQPGPEQQAGYQRWLRAMRFDHRYWDASNDSLRRALAGQRADTLRLQTLT